jgi:raffinose/stachyose/melibiose transport system permease protein
MDKLLKKLGAIFLLSVVFIQLVPFYIAFTTAFKPKIDLSSRWFFPKELYLDNFLVAIERGKMFVAMRNSAIITLISVVFVCVLGALAAYPLARIKSKVNTGILMIILGVMMVPPLSILVPLYSFMGKIGGINSYWAIILLMTTGQLPLSIFLYRSFITAIPVTLEEAARIDGANYLQVFYHIIIPLVKAITASVIILAGTFIWNDYQMSLYMMPSPDKRTVTTAVAAFFSQQSNNLGGATASALIGMFPIVALYIFLQKYFIKGMIDSAIK